METKRQLPHEILPLAGLTREESLENLFRFVKLHPESVIPLGIEQTDKEQLHVTFNVNPFHPAPAGPRDVKVYIYYNIYQKNDLYVRNIDFLPGSYISDTILTHQAISLFESLRKT